MKKSALWRKLRKGMALEAHLEGDDTICIPQCALTTCDVNRKLFIEVLPFGPLLQHLPTLAPLGCAALS